MMNLTMKDIKVGDEFKQVQSLGSYLFEDKIFTAESVDRDKSAISLSLKSQKTTPNTLFVAKLYLSLNELNESFERVKKFVWSDWKHISYLLDSNKRFTYEYKTNGRITFVRIKVNGKVFKGKATCHKEDLKLFDEKIGIDLARERAEEKLRRYTNAKDLKIGDRVKAISTKSCGSEFVFENAIGTIIYKCGGSLKVRWDKGCARDYQGDRDWYIDAADVEPLLEEKKSNFILEFQVGSVLNAPNNYALLHTIYAESEGEGIGLTQTIVDTFNIKEELKEELGFLLRISEFYNDDDNLKGDIITYNYKNVITLVTKRRKHDKVTYETIKRGFIRIRKHMEENNIKDLAMPCICCGHEKLDWKKIEEIINEVFSDCDTPLHIRVYVTH